jgi:chromosomal replication initiator protein
MAVAASPGTVYNPLFLYGGPGVGKTHLLHAIGQAAREQNPGIRVAFIDGENFTFHYVTALRERKIEEFRRHFRGIDVWLVDDIQFIASKEQTKEEFFHTFNALYQGGKQIVIASDRCPKDLRAMDERLRSRFEQGLIADIAGPELETRMAILDRRCAAEGWEVSQEILYYIAAGIQSNIRSLEGALTKLVAYASIMRCPLTTDLAQDVLGDFIIERPAAGASRKGVTMETILAAVAQQFGTNVETLRSERRDKAAVTARHAAMYLCREITGSGLAQIGAALGGRDHTTVQRGIARVERLLGVDSGLVGQLEESRRRLER